MKFLLIIYTLCSSLATILIKKGAAFSVFSFSNGTINVSVNLYFVSGVFLFLCSFCLWILIIRKFKLTFISPIVYGMSFVFIAIFSYFLLEETLKPLQFVGAGIILIGIVIISIQRLPKKNNEV